MVFFDIDGTLFNENKMIPESTAQAIYSLKEKGVQVALATGRAPFMFQEIIKDYEIDTYVSFNGSFVVHNNEVVYKNPLPLQQLQILEENAKTLSHPMVFLDHDFHYTNEEEHPFIKESISSLKIDYPSYDPTFYHNQEVYQALIFCESKDEKVYKQKHDYFDYVRWHRYSIDVLPQGGSKARGMEALLQKLQIPIENTYAFGDGLNDVEMLQFVGTGVAMGNGCEEAKAAADLVTTDVNQEGIMNGLKKLGLL